MTNETEHSAAQNEQEILAALAHVDQLLLSAAQLPPMDTPESMTEDQKKAYQAALENLIAANNIMITIFSALQHVDLRLGIEVAEQMREALHVYLKNKTVFDVLDNKDMAASMLNLCNMLHMLAERIIASNPKLEMHNEYTYVLAFCQNTKAKIISQDDLTAANKCYLTALQRLRSLMQKNPGEDDKEAIIGFCTTTQTLLSDAQNLTNPRLKKEFCSKLDSRIRSAVIITASARDKCSIDDDGYVPGPLSKFEFAIPFLERREKEFKERKKTLSDRADTIASLQKAVATEIDAANKQIAEEEKKTAASEAAAENYTKLAGKHFKVAKYGEARQAWLRAISSLESIQGYHPNLLRMIQIIACFIELIKCSAHTGDNPESYLSKIQELIAANPLTDHATELRDYYAGRFKELSATAEAECKAAQEAQTEESVQAVANAIPKLSLNA